LHHLITSSAAFEIHVAFEVVVVGVVVVVNVVCVVVEAVTSNQQSTSAINESMY